MAIERVLRAMLKAADIRALAPDGAAPFLIDKGDTERYDYARQAMQALAYGQWREYDHEEAVRSYTLRLYAAGLLTSTPQKLIAQGTDWRFLNDLKKELKG